MTRAAAGVLVTMLLAVTPAQADCFDWELAATVEQGTLRGLPPGPLRWRIGSSPAGGIHQASSVEVRWTDQHGRIWRQTLFEEIQDGRPTLRASHGRVGLRVAYCAAGGACRGTTLTYAWDRATHRFVGADRRARESLAAACGSVPEPLPPARSEPAAP